MNVAIITARKGSKSIRNKNVYEINGRPLIYYPIQAAIESSKISKIFISTDGNEIAKVGEQNSCEIIWRPDHLAGDDANHGDVIKFDIEYVDKKEAGLENVVILLGNTVMIDGPTIDDALSQLDADSNLDSVMTVWEAGDDHPLRAMEIHNGYLRPYGGEKREVSTARQSYSRAYFYDQGLWALRKECVESRAGPNPWWWMGKNSKPIIRP